MPWNDYVFENYNEMGPVRKTQPYFFQCCGMDMHWMLQVNMGTMTVG